MDDSVTVDWMEWADPYLRMLVAGRAPGDRLWPFTMSQLSNEFRASVKACGLEQLRPTLYALRHGGASEDFLRRRRPLDEIQRRGRWRCAASVRRYTKEAKMLSELHKVSPSILRYGEFIEERIGEMFADPQLFPSMTAWLQRIVP